MLEKNTEIQLEIESLSNDGSGVGRYGGFAVFVPYSAPGDLLAVKIVKTAPRYAYGIILKILRGGACRVASDCGSFGKCGGCSFRHISYPAELSAKRDFVIQSLKRIGGIDARVTETVSAEPINEYRGKVQLPVFDDGGVPGVGFYAPRSHRAVKFTDGCRLEPAEITVIAERCCALLAEHGVSAYDEVSRKGLIRHIVLRKSGADGSVMLALAVNGEGFAGEDGFREAVLKEFPAVKTVIININREPGNVILGGRNRVLFGSGHIEDRLCGVRLRLSLPSFFQINGAAAELLYKKIREYLCPSPDDRVLDLYCGAGSIGLSLAKSVKEVIGVEIVREAAADARYNAELNGIGNALFIEADAKNAAKELSRERKCIDAVVVDPPRKGCDPETLSAIKDIAPSRIVMVSCNPVTLARDLAVLDGYGFAAKEITPVDMFPRTKHVETAALLYRKTK